MPYASPHLLINYVGALPGGEQWSIGFRTIAATVAPADLQAYADYAQSAFGVLWASSSSPRVFNSLQVTETACTVRTIGTDGKTINQAVAVPATPLVGSASLPAMPDQSALVVSLLTARAGRSYRGRVYLPITAAGSLTAAGRVSDDNLIRQAALAFTANLCLLLQGSAAGVTVPAPVPAALFRVAIQSTVTNQPGAPVISLKVGDVIDTQRRRRNKLVENYLNTQLVTPAT